MELSQATATDTNGHRCAKPISIRARSNELDLEIVDAFFLREIADQHLWAVIEFVCHDVQITIVVEIENRRRSRAQCAGAGRLAGFAGAQLVLFVRSVAVECEPGLFCPSIPPLFDSKQELAVEKLFPTYVQKHGIDGVAKRVTH